MQEKDIIDIYIECSSTSPEEMDRQYQYLLECRSHPGNTRSGGDRLTGTYNMISLTALTQALERIKWPCIVYIHCRNEWMLNMLIHQLPRWVERDFQSSKGKQIAHVGLWKKIAELVADHELNTVKGKHAYSTWMKEEMEKGEQDVR